ncbi:MAG: hemolysin III family protein [Candidatus Latescibacteria bacterium]|nr:hemolysin III family protein [Candidatus Latescibacterota bacterium]
MRLRERKQSRGEEIANSISHGVGVIASIVAAAYLMLTTVREGAPARIIGAGVFSVTMVLVYVTSTLYHATTRERPKGVFRVLDHAAIFLLIAGTYTPFTLGVLRGRWGWTLLVVVWSLAILGIVLTTVSRLRYPTLSTALYVAMGWLMVVGVKPLWANMEPWGLLWLLAGGVAYTGGVAFFAADRIRFGHLIWHLFVMAGTACHYIAVLEYSF